MAFAAAGGSTGLKEPILMGRHKTHPLEELFSQLPGYPSGYPIELRWNAVTDAGAGSFSGLQLTITADNGQGSATAISPAFDARFLAPHPRALGADAISVISHNRREPVSLSIDLNDPIPEYSSMQLRFRVLGPEDWHAATVIKDWPIHDLPAGVTRGIQWDIGSDLPAGPYS